MLSTVGGESTSVHPNKNHYMKKEARKFACTASLLLCRFAQIPPVVNRPPMTASPDTLVASPLITDSPPPLAVPPFLSPKHAHQSHPAATSLRVDVLTQPTALDHSLSPHSVQIHPVPACQSVSRQLVDCCMTSAILHFVSAREGDCRF